MAGRLFDLSLNRYGTRDIFLNTFFLLLRSGRNPHYVILVSKNSFTNFSHDRQFQR